RLRTRAQSNSTNRQSSGTRTFGLLVEMVELAGDADYNADEVGEVHPDARPLAWWRFTRRRVRGAWATAFCARQVSNDPPLSSRLRTRGARRGQRICAWPAVSVFRYGSRLSASNQRVGFALASTAEAHSTRPETCTDRLSDVHTH